jgi:2',3'-cyclic-nucleotide 2'-phosphodiesterase (5'-nucleotidase family)
MRLLCGLVFVAGWAAGQTFVETDVLHSGRLLKRDDSSGFNMTFFHVNDIHAHLDEFEASGSMCTSSSSECFGGIARLRAAIESRRGTDPSLWLNAGDDFQGTMYWTYYKSTKLAEAANDLGFDAMAIGNHEFDDGDDELGRFVSSINFPVLGANIVSDHAVLNKTIIPYKIFWEEGVAVIGATTANTRFISHPGPGTQFLDVTTSIQRAVDEIRSTTNITRIVALTHIGYGEDMELARNTTGLSLIMGGHSHTLLGSMEGAAGPYPTIVENKDGQEVFVVTAHRWGERLGYINCQFDSDGAIIAYSGGAVHMGPQQPKKQELDRKVKNWGEPFEAIVLRVVGSSDVYLDHDACRKGDCILGQLVTDAMLTYMDHHQARNKSATATSSAESATGTHTSASVPLATDGPRSVAKSEGNSAAPDFALINNGGIRSAISAGPVTWGDVSSVFPFGNTVVQLEMRGSDVRDMFEGTLSRTYPNTDRRVTSGVQVSRGVEVRYNPDNASGHQVVEVFVGGEPLDDDHVYQVVTLDFVATGGDNIMPVVDTAVFSNETVDKVLSDYIEAHSPIQQELQQRIVAVDDDDAKSGGDTAPSSDSLAGSEKKRPHWLHALVGLMGVTLFVSAF